MEDDFNFPTGRTLRGADLLSPNGTPFLQSRRNPLPILEEGLEIMMQALRVVEHSPNNRGAISVINVCRRIVPLAGNRVWNRAVSWGRLLELADASLVADSRCALFIEDEERLDGLPALAAGPVHRDPVLAACRWARCGGAQTAVPPHRVAGDDELLQPVGLVSYSLLQQEDPTAMSEALNSHLAFGILNSVLDRRAAPRPPRE